MYPFKARVAVRYVSVSCHVCLKRLKMFCCKECSELKKGKLVTNVEKLMFKIRTC
jgi:hypothetical protein